MNDEANTQAWPVLLKDDAGLMKEIMGLLQARLPGPPTAYSSDGSFAAEVAALPPGLRAMAATHWLDLSLTLDSITWHFGNFGEPHLVELTETGLRELGLLELADCFRDAKELMQPLLAVRTDKDEDLHDYIRFKGADARADELNARGWKLHNLGERRKLVSAIYEAWILYTRANPSRVFGVWQ